MWGKPPESKLVKEMYSKGMEIANLFPQKALQRIIPIYNLQPEDLININCPLREIIAEESRTAEERNQAACIKIARDQQY